MNLQPPQANETGTDRYSVRPPGSTLPSQPRPRRSTQSHSQTDTELARQAYRSSNARQLMILRKPVQLLRAARRRALTAVWLVERRVESDRDLDTARAIRNQVK